MAGTSRTVTLNVIGNTTGATKALDEVAGKSESTAKRASSAFGGVLSTLNSTGVLGPLGESLDKISGMFDQIGEHGKAAGKALMGIGAAGVGIGGILTAAAGPDAQASAQLKTAIEAAGGSYEDFKDNIEKNIKSNEHFGHTAADTQDAIRILTQSTGDAKVAIGDMGVVADLAAAKHESLSAAAASLAKVHGGANKILKEFGIEAETAGGNEKDMAKATKDAEDADRKAALAKQDLVDLHAKLNGVSTLSVAQQIELRKAEENVTTSTQAATYAHQQLAGMHEKVVTTSQAASDNIGKLGAKLDGQASASADTFSGKMKALKAEVEDGAAKLGQKYGPALMGISSGVSIMGGVMEGATGIIGKFSKASDIAAVATEGLSGAEDVEAVSEGIALGPILLIIGALAAIGVAIYEMWTHWSTIWGWVKGLVSTVWDAIKGVFTAGVSWIGDRIGDIVGFFTSLPGKVAGAVSGAFNAVKNAMTDAKNWVSDRVGDIVSFLLSIPSKIVNLGADIFKSIMSHIPGGGLVSGIADKIGGILHFAAGGMPPVGVPSLVGENGPELFVPGTAGTIIPNHALGGGVSVGAINVYAAPGMDVNALANAVQSKLLQAGRGRVNLGLS